jgi:DNA-binding response OmpR family regulator
MNILIVDDDQTSRDLMCYAAKSAGHDHQCVATAKEAMPLLPKADLVLCDWEMPDFDGIEFVKHARSYGVTIPIIMVTVKDRYHDLEVAINSGASGFMSKPINVKELIARIKMAEAKLCA